MLVAVVGFFNIVALLLLWMEVFNSRRRRVEWLSRRSNLSGASYQAIDLRRKDKELTGLLYWLAKPLPDFTRLGDQLEYLHKNMTAKQYILRRVMITLIITLVVSVLMKKTLLLGVPLGLIFGVLLPLKMLQRAVDKRTRAFLKIFPDAIDLIVRGLRAGLPVPESMGLAAQEIEEPVGSVFATIISSLKLGMPLERALREEARKLDIPEFDFFTIAVGLQRETGGNLTEILSNLSGVLRGRARMFLKIRAISAEARASGVVLAALPFVIVAGFALFSPTYLAPLIHDHRGNVCAAVALCMLMTGLWVMRRVTRFEI